MESAVLCTKVLAVLAKVSHRHVPKHHFIMLSLWRHQLCDTRAPMFTALCSLVAGRIIVVSVFCNDIWIAVSCSDVSVLLGKGLSLRKYHCWMWIAVGSGSRVTWPVGFPCSHCSYDPSMLRVYWEQWKRGCSGRQALQYHDRGGHPDPAGGLLLLVGNWGHIVKWPEQVCEEDSCIKLTQNPRACWIYQVSGHPIISLLSQFLDKGLAEQFHPFPERPLVSNHSIGHGEPFAYEEHSGCGFHWESRHPLFSVIILVFVKVILLCVQHDRLVLQHKFPAGGGGWLINDFYS